MNTNSLVIIALYFFTLCGSTVLSAQAPYGNAGDHTAVELGNPETPFGYYEYLPVAFNNTSNDTYPLVLFYHGYGERGNGTTDLGNILSFGPPKLINQGSNFDAIVISPQNASGSFSTSDFLSLYNYLIANYPIDINRVYLTGLSAGGGGTWNALKVHSDKIAAAVPICGTGFLNDPSTFLQQTPIWAHHNFDDNVVGRNNTITNVNRIANISSSVMSVYPYGSVTSAADNTYSMLFDNNSQTWSVAAGTIIPSDKMSFTLHPNGGHDSWTETYENQDVWDWMFAQSLNALSVNEELIDFKLYPNPTSGKIHLKTKDNTEKKIEIYNLAGGKIYDNYFFKNIIVDMSLYASGVYFAKVIGTHNTQKMIKIIVN